MPLISIISSSVRTGRNSNRVALHFKNYLLDNDIAETEIIDLKEYDFPIFHEKLILQKNPSAKLLEFGKKIKSSDGIIIVTPEYNGGYPASLKNAIDVLYEEWHRKPIAIATVSAGVFGGSQVITALQFSLWKIRAWTVPATFLVPNVEDEYNQSGVATDVDEVNKNSKVFIDELLWCIEAKRRMQQTMTAP